MPQQPGDISRRTAVAGLLAASLSSSNAFGQSTSDRLKAIKTIISEFESDEQLSIPNYNFREFAEDFPLLRLERAPNKVKPSSLKISPESKDLIVSFEVSGQKVYTDRYTGAIFPGGRSGVTIGIGYDLGYVSYEGFRQDWIDLIEDQMIMALKPACGLTGSIAESLQPTISGVNIPYNKAIDQFNVEIQKYVTLSQRLPNFTSLPLHCRGALTSLVYNRGPSFDVPPEKDPKGRYRHMRAIRTLMADKNFAAVADQIVDMKVIWPDVRGLQRRRDAEAALFRLGLETA